MYVEYPSKQISKVHVKRELLVAEEIIGKK